MTDFVVRSMEHADLAQVGQLAGQLVRMHYDYDQLRYMKPNNPEAGYQRWFATQLDVPEVMLLVAADAEGICGYVFARLEGRDYNDLLEPHTKLHDILVHSRARGRGVGEALIEETFKRAAERGSPRVILLTASQNESAHRLFKRCGFRTTMLEMTAELPPVSPPQK